MKGAISSRETRFGVGCMIASVLASGAVWLFAGNRIRAEKAPPGSQSSEAVAWKDYKYEEAQACYRCHARPIPDDHDKGSLDFVLLTEFSIWKTHDKHAQAYAVLKGCRGEQIGRRLEVRDVTAEKVGCMNCHAMASLRTIEGSGVDKQDGVSCGGCHGPSNVWSGLHYKIPEWRMQSSEFKFQKGMRDLRDPVVRAELCMSCHIGNAEQGKVVTHAMYAAGHPPLPPIEIATFSKNEPQHWRDARDVPLFRNPDEKKITNFHLEGVEFHRTKAALVGSVVALRVTMKLAADRADEKAAQPQRYWPELLLQSNDSDVMNADKLRGLVKDRWPELALAHMDCYACHHELKNPGFRQARGFGYQLPGQPLIRARPGSPLIRAWPTTLLAIAAKQSKSETDTLTRLHKKLAALAQTCSDKPYGDIGKIRDDCSSLVEWCDGLIAEMKATHFTRELVLHLMREVCADFIDTGDVAIGGKNPPILDYESARQLVSLLDVMYADLFPKNSGDKQVLDLLGHLKSRLAVNPYIKREERTKVILEVVTASSEGRDVSGIEKFADYLKDIGDEATLKELTKSNNFLATMQSGIRNQLFMENMLKKATIKKLQDLSDAELQASLRIIADYDPQVVNADLKALFKALKQAQ